MTSMDSVYTVFTRAKNDPRKIKKLKDGLSITAARELCSKLNFKESSVWYEFTTTDKFKKKAW